MASLVRRGLPIVASLTLCPAVVTSAQQRAAGGLVSATPIGDDTLTEVNARFTIRGRPVHPGLIERFERWESDAAEPAVITVDALAAAGSNEYEDKAVKLEGGSVTMVKESGQGYFAYKWLGTVTPGVHVVETYANGGGSGIFETLLVLRASAGTDTAPTALTCSSCCRLCSFSLWATGTTAP